LRNKYYVSLISVHLTKLGSESLLARLLIEVLLTLQESPDDSFQN